MMPQPLSADLISGFQIYFPANQERNISYILTMCMHIYIYTESEQNYYKTYLPLFGISLCYFLFKKLYWSQLSKLIS